MASVDAGNKYGWQMSVGEEVGLSGFHRVLAGWQEAEDARVADRP
jgi:hypothetical protein